MLIERIKTSLWLPKIIIGATIALFSLSAILVFGYITITPSGMVEEAAKITDQLTYKVIVNGDN